MAFTLTTLSSAVGVNDTTVLLASLTGLSAGNLLGIDKEVIKVLSVPAAATTPVPVLRGQEGSFNAAHVASAQVKIGATGTNLVTADWTQPLAGAPSVALYPGAFGRDVISYSAAGAITLPRAGADMVAIINGTSVVALTLANPGTGTDGSFLHIVGNGKAAHTVTFASALGNNGTPANADVITFFATASQCVTLISCGGFWCSCSAVSGAATLAGPGIG